MDRKPPQKIDGLERSDSRLIPDSDIEFKPVGEETKTDDSDAAKQAGADPRLAAAGDEEIREADIADVIGKGDSSEDDATEDPADTDLDVFMSQDS
ncbi:MAG: hypothetical protein ACOC9Y_08600, partial [Chloroflexota bacterium]